ncbi:MAG: hypothetical protein AB7F89_21955, partial [Pirellulaceae bacterium]
DYLSLLAVADVVLDPIHFGGGNSSYEAFSVGAPVVTFPGQYLRSRITAALYVKMGFTDLIAATPDEYVALCLRVGRDQDYRTYVREQIRIRSAVLFADLGEVAGLEAFLWSLTGQTSPSVSLVSRGQIA